jgi:hypothetical protein
VRSIPAALLAGLALTSTLAATAETAGRQRSVPRLRSIRDTIVVRRVDAPPSPDRLGDTARWGARQAVLGAAPGAGSVWLLRLADSVYLVALVADSSRDWGDEIVASLDTDGDRAAAPQHDDFQWCFRRQLDSSVVYNGRAGKWAAPRDDPDWRLGPVHSGDGWDVREGETADGWIVVLRLDAGWLEQAGPRGPGLTVRAYDAGRSAWQVWPEAPPGAQPVVVERTPALWAAVRP